MFFNDSLDSHGICSSQYIIVSDIVIPTDVQGWSQFCLMKDLKSVFLLLICCPSLTAVEQCWKHNSLIHHNFCLGFQVMIVEDIVWEASHMALEAICLWDWLVWRKSREFDPHSIWSSKPLYPWHNCVEMMGGLSDCREMLVLQRTYNTTSESIIIRSTEKWVPHWFFGYLTIIDSRDSFEVLCILKDSYHSVSEHTLLYGDMVLLRVPRESQPKNP